MSYPLVEIGHTNRHRWETMAETYVSLGMTTPNYSSKAFFFDPNQNQITHGHDG